MRIIGGHDYYDGAVPYDTDKTRVFNRVKDKSIIFNRDRIKIHTQEIRNTSLDLDKSDIQVIVAGVHYKGIRVAIWDGRSNWTPEFYWKYDKFIRFLDSIHCVPSVHPKGKYRHDGLFEDNLEQYFKPVKISEDKQQKLVKDGVVTAISAQYYQTQISWPYRDLDKWDVNNDGLSAINFQQAVDPWSIYQEIDMYLGTILVNDQDAMVRVSDKDRIAQYGFDNWSFRNQVHPAKPRHK